MSWSPGRTQNPLFRPRHKRTFTKPDASSRTPVFVRQHGSGGGKSGLSRLPVHIPKLTPRYKAGSVLQSICAKGAPSICSWNGAEVLVCSTEHFLNLCDMHTLKVLGSIPSGRNDEDSIASFCCSDEFIALAFKSSLIELYRSPATAPFIAFKSGQPAPVVKLAVDAKSGAIAVAYASGAVRLHSLETGALIAKLPKAASSVPTNILFIEPRSLVVTYASGSITLWDCEKNTVFEDASSHSSSITSICASPKEAKIVTASRDKTLAIWDILRGKISRNLSISSGEVIECCAYHPTISSCFVSVGSSGQIRLWSHTTGQERSSIRPFKQPKSLTSIQTSLQSSFWTIQSLDGYLLKVGFDLKLLSSHIITLGQLSSAVFLNSPASASSSSHSLALSSTSSDIVVLPRHDSLECLVLEGHASNVLSLSFCEKTQTLVSGSKDSSVIAWKLHEAGESVATSIYTGHGGAISAVAISPSGDAIASASVDLTMKLWHCGKSDTSKGSLWTVKAHEKDVNYLSFSPDGQRLASASQDRTARIWNCSSGMQVSVLSGHKRGVWCVKFSQSEDLIATCSADRTIKLWSSSSYACLRTLEGHMDSVLSLCFLGAGKQLASTSSDGLLKTWDVRSGACSATMDSHYDRVWSVDAMNGGDLLLTASDDGTAIVWENCLEQLLSEQLAARETSILREQEFQNLLASRDFERAFRLAVQSQKPAIALKTLVQLCCNSGYDSLVGELSRLTAQLSPDTITQILAWIREWNSSLSHLVPSQLLLNAIIQSRLHKELCPASAEATKDYSLLKGIVAYSVPHVDKIDAFLSEGAILDLLIRDMA